MKRLDGEFWLHRRTIFLERPSGMSRSFKGLSVGRRSRASNPLQPKSFPCVNFSCLGVIPEHWECSQSDAPFTFHGIDRHCEHENLVSLIHTTLVLAAATSVYSFTERPQRLSRHFAFPDVEITRYSTHSGDWITASDLGTEVSLVPILSQELFK